LKSKYTVTDNIFNAPKEDVSNQFDALTRKEKLAVVRLKVRLNTYFTKQNKGNKVKITKQKTALQSKLQKVINKTKNKKKKQTLQYLKIIL
jgi:undecaprenyl pyrophosphate synthase